MPSAPKQIIRSKILGQDNHPTIYYLTGFGSTMEQYRLHVFFLRKFGYRVMIFDYKKDILEDGDPKTLIACLQYIADVIKADIKGRKVAGVYGVSLGGWLGLNLVQMLDINKGLFNTGGAGILSIAWNKPVMATAKANFIKNGETLESLHKTWHKYDYDTDASRFGDQKIIIMDSTGDETIEYREAARNVAAWREQGVDARLITSRGLRHTPVIIRNMLRLKLLKNFFSQD